MGLLSGAAIGRAALGQVDTGFTLPVFQNTPYILRTSPGGSKISLEVSVTVGSFSQNLTWGVEEQSGCGIAYFGPDPTTLGEETYKEYTNLLHFQPSQTWAPPYRINIFVTDGNYTIRTQVFIYLAGQILLPEELSMDDYQIFLADRDFNLGAQISYFTEATFVTKFNNVGTFSITMEQSDAPKAGWGETDSGTYGNIILTRNEAPIFWGVITEFERNWDEDKDELIIRGEDTLRYLETRVTLPVHDRKTAPSGEYPDVPIYSSTIYDVRPAPTISAVSYVGSGNSASQVKEVRGAGASVDSTIRTYRIWVSKKSSEAGAPDEFSWKEMSTGNTSSGSTKITAKAQSIDNSVVSFQFSQTTGFTLGSATSNYWTFTFRQSTARAEQVIKSFVRDNLGSGALIFRQKSGFTIEPNHSPALGNFARGRARFDNLLELIQDIALPDLSLPREQRIEVQFYMEGLTFKIREVADLTDKIKLSKDLDTIKRFSYTAKASKGNYLYVGGKGSEGDREVIEWGNNEGSIPRYGLIERFVDATGGDSITDLYATAIEELVKTQDNTTMEVEPIDKPFMTIIDDYWVGDKVTAIVDGSEFQEVIREATISITGGDVVRITPVLGTPDTRSEEVLELFRRVRQLDSRLGGFERR